MITAEFQVARSANDVQFMASNVFADVADIVRFSTKHLFIIAFFPGSHMQVWFNTFDEAVDFLKTWKDQYDALIAVDDQKPMMLYAYLRNMGFIH